MANEEHLGRLKRGVKVWNQWRWNNSDVFPDLRGAFLGGANLRAVDLRRTDLRGAVLRKANLRGAILEEADLNEAYLEEADLRWAVLRWAVLRWAILGRANLRGANLGRADLGGGALKEVFSIRREGFPIRRDPKGHGADPGGANLSEAILEEADLRGAALRGANLAGADLAGANLIGADLRGADLYRADLCRADLSKARLDSAFLSRADLEGANLEGAALHETVFGNTNLRGAKGLSQCQHGGPSTIDMRTLRKSWPLPLSFLRGVGLDDAFIEYLPSLVGTAIEFYSCFISHSTRDADFAERLYNDLQGNGVRCWYAPEDMKGGRKTHEQIFDAIRLHEKLLLVLSEHSMNSTWVETEIRRARKHEREEGRRLLFPVSLCSYEELHDWELFDADEGRDLASEVREYFIPDFSDWRNHDAYQEAFKRLLRDLRTGDSGQ